MASTDKKKFKITESSKQASVDITSDKIILPADSADHLLVATIPSGANVNDTVNVEVEMSPDGENWCDALVKQSVTTAGSTTSEVKGNEQYADLTVNSPVFNGHAKGSLSFDNSGNTTTEDAGTRDFMHQHIEANKCFNQSMWIKSSTAPTTTYKPVLFRHGGYDNFENQKVVKLDSSTTTTFAITVSNPGSGNLFYIDAVSSATAVDLVEGNTYIFDQSDSSSAGHPLRFSTTSNGSHGGGSEYTTGVTVVGTPGSAGAYTKIVVADSAPTLYYYCTQHSGMGGQLNTLTATLLHTTQNLSQNVSFSNSQLLASGHVSANGYASHIGDPYKNWSIITWYTPKDEDNTTDIDGPKLTVNASGAGARFTIEHSNYIGSTHYSRAQVNAGYYNLYASSGTIPQLGTGRYMFPGGASGYYDNVHGNKACVLNSSFLTAITCEHDVTTGQTIMTTRMYNHLGVQRTNYVNTFVPTTTWTTAPALIYGTDEFMAYDIKLTDAEIEAHFTNHPTSFAYSTSQADTLTTTPCIAPTDPTNLSTWSNAILYLRGGDASGDSSTALQNVAGANTHFPASIPKGSSSANLVFSSVPNKGTYLTSNDSQDAFTVSSNLSISGWFKTTDTGTLFSNTEGALTDGLKMEVNASNMVLTLIDSSQTVTASSDVDDGEWHHLVVTKPSGTTPTIKIYVDGVEKVSTTVSTISNDDLRGGNGFTLLGDGQNNVNATSPASTDSSKLNASLSNWSLHTEVLSANAVSQLYSNGHVRNIKNLPGVSVSSIEAWWQLADASNPQNDLAKSNPLAYQDGASAALTSKLVNSDGATYVNGSINGNAITMSLTKSFNFTTNKWVSTADQDAAICLSFNGFEEQAEYFALWKCTQTVPSGSVNILDGGWHNLILSYRGINDLTGNNNVVAGNTEVRFGVGDGATDEEYHFNLSIDGYPMALVSGTDKVGADYIGGLGSTLATETIDGVSKNVKFVIENRHLRYDSNNNEEEYKPHGQFSAAIHPFSASETDPNNFRGSVDETSFHSQCFWLNQGSTGVQAIINQEKPYTIYGRTTALDNRGTSNTYPIGVPYPLLNPELLKNSGDINDMISTNQFINPVPKGQTQPWNSQVSTGGLEAWYRWGDTDGDCSVDIKDVRTHNANGYDRFLTAVELDDTANVGNVKSAQGESIYLQSQSASTSSGSSSTTFVQVKLEDLSTLVGTAACTIKNMSSQVLQYLRIKLTGNGTCDIGDNKLKVEIHYKKRRMK
tara:strand:+ start:958 stop:4689 length:3732 start_codon:yes stop_codon:yes gene_type:complete